MCAGWIIMYVHDQNPYSIVKVKNAVCTPMPIHMYWLCTQTHFWGSNLWHLRLARVPVSRTRNERSCRDKLATFMSEMQVQVKIYKIYPQCDAIG